MSSAVVGPQPCNVVCPGCKNQVQTKCVPKASTKTHIIALLLCLFACWPCACCLYCTDCARNLEHYCPSCNTFIGVYER